MAQLSNPTDVNSEINAQDFMLRQFLGRHAFITLGQVVAVDGEFIDARPMVMGVAADGSPVEHEVIYNLPVWRLQGGSNAVIMPPHVGDIGFLGICDRDISAVKATRQAAMPGSKRTHNSPTPSGLAVCLTVRPSSSWNLLTTRYGLFPPGKWRFLRRKAS